MSFDHYSYIDDLIEQLKEIKNGDVYTDTEDKPIFADDGKSTKRVGSVEENAETIEITVY